MQSGSRHALFEHVKHDRDLGILFRDVTGPALQFPWHFHPELELTFIRGGSGVRYVGDSIQPFEDGDLCLIGSGTAHRWMSHEKVDAVTREEPDNLFSFVVLQFNPDVFGPGFLELGSAQPLKDLFERAALGASIHGETRRLVVDSLETMLTRRVSPLERVSGLLDALTKIALAPGPEVVTLSSAPTEQPQELKQEQRVKRLISHIGENAGQSLPEKEVAALVGLSPAAFSRFFRRTFGKPFVRYVAEVRVAHACRLLAESTRSIADVAFEVGFNNLANFNRRFRALRGMTPSAYRTLARRMI